MLYLLDSRVAEATLVKCYKFSLLDLSKISTSGNSDVFFTIDEDANASKITDFLRLAGVKFLLINNIAGYPNNNICYQLDNIEIVDFNSDSKLQEKLKIGRVNNISDEKSEDKDKGDRKDLELEEDESIEDDYDRDE